MQDVVQRNREVETSRQGLILEKAWYGKLVSDVTADGPDNISVIDVTIPLQCQVKDSKLLLTDVSKVEELLVEIFLEKYLCHYCQCN